MYDEFKKCIPGFLQGITRVCISYPFDVIKVNMQTLNHSTSYKSFRYILANDPHKFYRGSSLLYTSVGVERSIQFYLLEKYNKKYNPYISGACVSLLNSIYSAPLQYLTTAIAASKERVPTFQYIKNKIRASQTFYKGYWIDTIKTQLGSTLFLGSYYYLRNNYGEHKSLSPFYGALSGLFVWSIIFPIDTVKTVYQTSDSSVKHIIKSRLAHAGIFSFYKGIVPIIVRTIPSASIGMTVYEYARQYLQI